MKAYVYIITNDNNKVLYTGVTSDLKDRVIQHRNGKYRNSFTSRYSIKKLVYYECFNSILEAINREKQIKAGSRQRKINLVNNCNPEWLDLCDQLKDG